MLVASTLHSSPGRAQGASTTPPVTPSSSSVEELARDLNDIFNDPNTSNAFWGVSIQSLDNGQYFYRLNDSKSFLPASNLKLFTAAEALTTLGPDFHFTTQLITNGRQTENTLRGDLIIRGAGDPTLGTPAMFADSNLTPVFEAWADSLHRAGITRIEGGVVGDDCYFTEDVYPLGWSIEDEPYGFAMQSSGLSFAENQVTLSISPGKRKNEEALYEVNPSTDYVTIENSGKTKADSVISIALNGSDTVLHPGSTSIEVSREFGTNLISIKGLIPLSGKLVHEQISVENPTLYAATVLREALEARGIRVSGKTKTVRELKKPVPYLKARVLATYSSPPLTEIVSVMNKHSDNHIAEQLFRTVAKEAEGEGSWRKGIEAMKHYLSNIGIAPDRISIYDGSGMSRMNLVSPSQTVTLLKTMYNSPSLFSPFWASLPIMGTDGTLANRLKDTKAQNNIRAKTGFVTGVRSISGYLTTRDGETLAFSIFANNYTVPVSVVNNIQDVALLRLVNFARK